jgi:hypothetical protein
MEVHKHPHHVMHKKNWGEYLLEFLMIFLAVTLGFLAENQREHLVDHNRERQFIRSMFADLKSDTNQLNSSTRFRKKLVGHIDSLIYYLTMPDPDEYGKFIYYYARRITNHAAFLSNDGTIQQLKNAGNLRLIRNHAVSDSIMRYDWEVRRNAFRIERQEDFIKDYVEVLNQICDGSEFDKMMIEAPFPLEIDWSWPKDNPHLIRKDRESIQQLINSVHFIRSINTYYIRWDNDMVNRASNLLTLMKNEYHLENE